MLRFVPGHFQTKKLFKNAVKKFPFVIKYVADRYKTKHMCDKDSPESGRMLGFAPDCYKDEKFVIKLLIIILMH